LFQKALKLLRGLLDQKVPNAEPLFCGETMKAIKNKKKKRSFPPQAKHPPYLIRGKLRFQPTAQNPSSFEILY
jgi:hypothetical protein